MRIRRLCESSNTSRFAERLEDPKRNRKISKSDYTERALWGDYIVAFEDGFSDTSTREVPWYIILSNRKWFCNLAEERK